MKKILWNYNKSASQNEGYKTSAEQISSRLYKKGLNSQIFTGDSPIPISVFNLISQSIYDPGIINCDSNDIVINNTLPFNYKISNGYNIGFSYWETTRIPKEWVDNMNAMDEIWTTSDFIKKSFIDSGVTVPVYSFSLGIDEYLYNPILRRKNTPFTFLSIGSPSTRKNSQMTVDAYVELFGNDDRYKLIYKSMGEPDARLFKNTPNMTSISKHPCIEVIEDDLSDNDLASLYDQVDCLVYPTSGEGWGWLPFQSIAKAIPTICTSGTACSEYAHLSIPLDFEWSSEGLFGLYNGNGEWMKPNFQDLCDKMLDVTCNYEKYANETYRNVVEVFKYMTWDYAIEGYYQRICQILNQL
jgi:glycosyltransferase involved in cell wall biosynthesis